MASPEIRVVVSAAVDGFDAAMTGVNRTLDNARKRTDRAADSLKSFGDQMEKLGARMSVVSAGIGAAAGSAFLLTRNVANSAREVQRMAQIANTTPEAFQRFAAGARSVGIEQDKMADILKDVNDRVGDFLSTGGGPMADFFENIAPKVGVTADQFARLSGPEALQLYVSSLEKAGVSQQEMTFYLEAMASDATALVPLLRNGGAEMERFGAAAESAGAIMDDSAIAASNDFNAALLDLQNSFAGVKNRLATTLMPIMTRFMEIIQSSTIPAVDSLIVKFGEFADYVSGLPQPVLEAAGLIGAALGVGGPILLGIGLVSKAIGALIGAAGPIGLFIAAASTLYAAWQIWGDDIMALFGRVTDYMGERFGHLVPKVMAIIDAITQPMRGLANLLMAIFDGDIRAAFEALGEIMSAPFVLIDSVLQAFGINVRDGIGSAVTFMRDQFTAFLEFIRTIPAQLLEIGSMMIQGLLDGIMIKWEELKLKIYELGELLPQWMREMLDIQSPSRVFEDIGMYIGEGLAQGIADSQALVAQATDTLGQAAVTSTQGTVQSVLGALGTLFQGSKKFAIAQALINTWQGATEALKLRFPANIAAFAKVIATGMNAVKNIRSAQPGGGGAGGAAGSSAPGAATGGGTAAAAQAPTQTLNFQITNDPFGFGERIVRQIAGQLNESTRNGTAIRATVS